MWFYRQRSIQLSGGAGGGEGTSTPQLTPEQLVSMYNQALPGTVNTIAQQSTPTQQAIAQGAASANPIYTASGLQQLMGFAPMYSGVGNYLTAQQAGANANLLANQGQDITKAANALEAASNPAQTAANNQAANLVNSYNLNGLTGGEQAAVERSLNQSNYATGNLGIDNATNAVSNAMNFGNALNAKRAGLNTALGTAAGVSSAQNAVFNPVTTTFNAGNTSSNFGLSNFNPTQANATATTPFSAASAFGNQIAGLGAAAKQTNNNSSASGGCFITTVVCEHLGLPDDGELLNLFRRFRDNHVPKELVKEYYEIAPAIAEKLRGSEYWLDYATQNLLSCAEDILLGETYFAIATYKQLVNTLKENLK